MADWRVCRNEACATDIGYLPPSEFSLAPHRGVCNACIRESGVEKISTRCSSCGKTIKANVHSDGYPRCVACSHHGSRRS
jgi:predicted amidophosphoribosyltransferase